MDIKAIDLWTAIQKKDGWPTACFADGIYLSVEGSKIVVEIMKVLRDADREPSLHWKSLPTEFEQTPFVFTSPCIQNPDGVNRNRHKSLEHLDEGDRELDVGGVREPEGKGVQSSNGYHRFKELGF
ncbi:GDSL esterase/lipase At2g38180-like [Quercus robur]|uniref:GDSL esterase/lipase At2g38180-like n=1 Tax=Quercus robur TaxID=38942 RepID=UPI002162BB25|nr:GDSL esterase/lipase At2g38180-like [Quercus robur]